ncbi:MAG: isoleucine--tRNA ligase, partial [Verrucomicrobiia bacterium]
QDDYHLAHHLGLLSPVDDQGRFTAECGVPSLVGKYVFDANADVVALLREKGALVHEEKIRHSYPHCWRSKTPVIFRAVDQWFIRIEDFRKKALEAVGSVKWIPSWGENRIRGTIESRGDWCISRQRSWGVPLPIFYKPDGEPILSRELALKVADLVEKHGTDVWFDRDADALATELGLPKGLRKSAETLDVWIDSGSSHRAVLARHPDLAFPADVYLEGSDQHRGWFQSSLLTSVVANGGRAPYRTVITHGFLVDLDGKKISKSSAYEKPKDAEAFVARYGADVLRLWVASEDYQGDVPLSEEIFARIGETYRSIRNSLRILLGNLHGFDPARDAVDFANPTVRSDPWCAVDLWMLDRLDKLVSEVRDAYDKYEFHRVYHAVNAFCAVTLSAFYVDVTKDRLYCDRPDSRRRRATQTVMHATASTLCRLLAPILSFTAEEAWGHLIPGGKSVHLQLLPDPSAGPATREAVEAVDLMLAQRESAARVIEAQRAAGKIGKSLEARVLLRPGEAAAKSLASLLPQLAEILIVSQAEVEPSTGEPAVAVPLGSKCERCWRWDNTVGNDASSPNLCARCADAWKTALTLAPGETLTPDLGPCPPGRSGG